LSTIRSDRLFTIPGVVGIIVAGVATAIVGKRPILGTRWILLDDPPVRHLRPRVHDARRSVVLLAALILGTAHILPSQALAPSPPAWRPTLRNESPGRIGPVSQVVTSSGTHSHTLTGLLIGSVVGAAATGVFLALFCSDPDTRCGAHEVGRAVVIIAIPPAVAGAVIGSLVRTKT
jgi:hypothetical protein